MEFNIRVVNMPGQNELNVINFIATEVDTSNQILSVSVKDGHFHIFSDFGSITSFYDYQYELGQDYNIVIQQSGN